MHRAPLPLPGATSAAYDDSEPVTLLRNAPRDRAVVLVLRHAAREAIRASEDGWTAPLTEAGREQARATGAAIGKLEFDALTAVASPAPRCLDTAQLLLVGAGEPAQVRADPRFGGPYVLDQECAFRRMLQLGNAGFLRAWFDGGWADAMQPAAEAARDQFRALLSVLRGPGPAVRIVVSHDWNIALLRDRILSLPHEQVGLPGFLSGLLLYESRGRIVVSDHGGVRWADAP